MAKFNWGEKGKQKRNLSNFLREKKSSTRFHLSWNRKSAKPRNLNDVPMNFTHESKLTYLRHKRERCFLLGPRFVHGTHKEQLMSYLSVLKAHIFTVSAFKRCNSCKPKKSLFTYFIERRIHCIHFSFNWQSRTLKRLGVVYSIEPTWEMNAILTC